MNSTLLREVARKSYEHGQHHALTSVLSTLGQSVLAHVLKAEPQQSDAPQSDPHAALLLAQLDHIIQCKRNGTDYRRGHKVFHELWDKPKMLGRILYDSLHDQPARVRKAVIFAIYQKAAEHSPKGGVHLTNAEGAGQFYPGGEWIPASTIAKLTPEQRKDLSNRQKSDGGTAAAKPTPAPRDTSRAQVATIARDVLLNPKDITPSKLRDLSEAVATATENNHLTLHDLMALRLRMSAAFGDQQQIVDALTSHVEQMIGSLTGKEQAQPQQPSALQPSSPHETPKPGTFAVVPTESLSIDPKRFQFKIKVNEAGVTKELEGVKRFNPDLAGVLSVWHDPSDGKTYVVNGHHRFELARRTGYPELAVRYIDAKDAREARAVGAVVNIAEGRGTPIDVAKFLRDAKKTVTDLEQFGVSRQSSLARDGDILTRLNDAAFDRLARGGLDLNTALAVAKHLSDPTRQEKLFKIIAKREEDGKEFTNRHLEEMARQMAAASSATVTEQTLWGDEDNEDDTFLERSELTSHVRNELARAHHDYGALSSQRRAEATSEAGNKLNVEENKKRAEAADVHKHAFDTLAYRKGAISDALDNGAMSLKTAKTKKERERVRKETFERVRAAIEDAAAGRTPDAGGVGGVVSEGDGDSGVEPPTPEPAGAGAISDERGRVEDVPAGLSAASATSPAMAPEPSEPAPGASWIPGVQPSRQPHVSKTSVTSPAMAQQAATAAPSAPWIPGAPQSPKQPGVSEPSKTSPAMAPTPAEEPAPSPTWIPGVQPPRKPEPVAPAEELQPSVPHEEEAARKDVIENVELFGQPGTTINRRILKRVLGGFDKVDDYQKLIDSGFSPKEAASEVMGWDKAGRGRGSANRQLRLNPTANVKPSAIPAEQHKYERKMADEITRRPGIDPKDERTAAVAAIDANREQVAQSRVIKPQILEIPLNDSRFINGRRVRHLEGDQFQVERRGGFLTGTADEIADHISQKASADQDEVVTTALKRAEVYEEPDPFESPAEADADAKARQDVPIGTMAVSLDPNTHGRVGTVARNPENGHTYLKFEGGEETRGKDFEPLNAAHSWRAPAEEREEAKPKGGETGDLFDTEEENLFSEPTEEAEEPTPVPASLLPNLKPPGGGERSHEEMPPAPTAAAEPEAKPIHPTNDKLNELAANTIPRAELRKTHIAGQKYKDMFEHGYSVNHWFDPGNPSDQVLEFNPRPVGERKEEFEGRPRLTARNGDELQAIHDALGVPVPPERAKKVRPLHQEPYRRAYSPLEQAKRDNPDNIVYEERPDGTINYPDPDDHAAVVAAGLPLTDSVNNLTEHFTKLQAAGQKLSGYEAPDREKLKREKEEIQPVAELPPQPSAEPEVEEKPQEVPEPPMAPATESSEPPKTSLPHVDLANRLAERLSTGSLEKNELWKHADEAFGGTRAEGKYGPSDAYDALEAGLNKSLRDQTDPTADLASAQEQARHLESIVDSLPTQTNRSGTKESHQQFSTPPHYAFAANWLANLKPTDHVLEPSAGTGSISVHAQNAGAIVHGNEIDERRADFLRDQLGTGNAHVEDAEQISGILPQRGVKPSVVVMNPPFSQTAGRLGDKKQILTGAKHIEEAGRMLAPNGRLVAIVGEGMTPEARAYAGWFNGMKKGFTLRANVGVSGDEYKKYGTSFGTRMLVFDKVPASADSPAAVTGDAADISDLMAKLEGVRNDRPELAPQPSGEQVRDGVPEGTEATERPERDADADAGTDVAPDGAAEESAVAGVPTGTEGAGGIADGGRSDVGEQPAGVGVRSDGAGGGKPAAEAAVEGAGEVSGPAAAGTAKATQRKKRGKAAGGKPVHEPASGVPSVRPPERVKVEPITSTEDQAQTRAGTADESLYRSYRPSRMKIPGAKPHITPLVESAAMAAVQPPIPTYQPHLSPDVIENAVKDVKNPDGTVSPKPIGLSEAALESLVYAGQAHNSYLQAAEGQEPNRRGFFIGDGTGSGKGRQIAGVMLDNKNQGKQKHVWITERDKLFNDAKRDWADLGEDPNDIIHWDQLSKKGFKAPKGIAFATYSTLRGGPRDQTKPRNIDHLINWLGKDFDGVIAFDESHNAGNADDTPGPRGIVKASQQAQAIMKLQRALPNAKILYVSATGATKPENLAYGDRLGLWGRGTAFDNKAEFLNAMSHGGTSAMEAVAQSMKARGLYVARSMSYDGVKTDRLQHNLSDEQKYVYDNLAEGWQHVLQNVDKAIESIAGGKEEAKQAGAVTASARGQFQAAQQRFFNQVITAMMVPTVIKHMENDLKEGRSPVVQLVNTMEAATTRALKSREEGEDLEEIDISPKQILVDFLNNSFPVHRLHEVQDEAGNTRMEVVKDSAGNPVEDPQAVAMRDELISRAHDLKIPSSPLDQIVNHFGHENVAEATGRTVRLVKKLDENGTLRLTEEKRQPKTANESETRAYQGNKKKIMIFSEAGATGASYHADRNAKNQAQRSHYLLQPGWRADKAVQGLGRTHRTNQVSAPIFHLLETPEIPGQKRFVSTIAKRLGQLGALTRGQAKTGGGVELFGEADNLESNEAQAGLESFINSMRRGGAVNEMGYEDLMTKLGFKVEPDAGGSGWRTRGQRDVPEMRQFLNRVLALKLGDQQAVFRELDHHISSQIEQARANGTLDAGVEDYKADKVARASEDETVYRDPDTGAEAKLVRTQATRKNPRRAWIENSKGKLPLKYVRNARSGQVWAVYEAAPKTEGRTGNIVPQYTLRGPGGTQHLEQTSVDATPYRGTGFDRIEHDEAQQLWDTEHAELPESIDTPEHFVTGDILSVWDKLPNDRPKIYRVNMADGTSIVGRHVPANQVEDTLKRLGAASKGVAGAEHDPSTVHTHLLRGGVAKLANGWSLRRSMVGHERRIELIGPIGMHKHNLMQDGVRMEKIASKERYFIPTGNDGAKVLENVIKSRNSPVIEVRNE